MDLALVMQMHSRGIMSVVCFLIFLLMCQIPLSKGDSSAATAVNEANAAAGTLDYDAVVNHTDFFSSLPSRVTGYPGSYSAAKYIENTLRSFGLEPLVQNYSVVVPVDHGSYIDTLSPVKRRIGAYALWPNGPDPAFTPPGHVTGRLVYVGTGEIERFNDLDLNDTIALMDFNSGLNWLEAANLGVKGVIFTEPASTTAVESLKKTVPVPIRFPRLYVNTTNGELLKTLTSSDCHVSLCVNMSWVEVTAYNVMAVVEGKQYKNDVAVISAHYDSWSIVPHLAVGREDSLGLSTLLEFARFLATNEPLRTTWIVAYSGYYQGMAGPYEWVEQNFFIPQVQSGETRIWLQIDLDLSTDSDSLDALYWGAPLTSMYWGAVTYGQPRGAAEWTSRYSPVEAALRKYVTSKGLQDKLKVNFVGATMNWGTQPVFRDNDYFYFLETTPALQAGILGFTLRTQYAFRSSWWTPLSDTVTWSNLTPQIDVAFAAIVGFLNDTQWPYTYVKPARFVFGALTGLTIYGFSTLDGQVAEFNVETGWYTPTAKTLVRLYPLRGIAEPDLSNAYLLHPFYSRYTFSGVNGSFIFHGLLPYYDYQADAWMFNETDGNIIYVVDNGIYGTAQGFTGGTSNWIFPTSETSSVLIPVFKGVSISFFDFTEPSIIRPAATAWTWNPFSVGVYDHPTRSTPIFFGQFFSRNYGAGVVFVPERTRITITFNPFLGVYWKPQIILANCSESEPEGRGYLVEKPTAISMTSYQAARDMYFLTKGRYGGLEAKNIRNSGFEKLVSKGEDYFRRAEEALGLKDYAKAYGYSSLALASLGKAYSKSLMPIYDEVSTFLLFITVPSFFFAILFERLILHGVGRQRIIGISTTLLCVFGFLGLMTPVFTVITNSSMGLLGVGMFLLTCFITLIFLREGREIISAISEERMGRHEVSSERVAALIYTIGTAVENMRKRKLMTAMTLATIIAFAAAQTAFTSVSRAISLTQITVSHESSPYTLIGVKRQYAVPPDLEWGGVLDVRLVETLEAIWGKEFHTCPRVWMYPMAIYPYGVGSEVVNSKGEKFSVYPLVLLGMNPIEAEEVFDGYVASGDVLLESPASALLSEGLANILRAEVGEPIYVRGLGQNLTVTGIISSWIPEEELEDFDGRSILPATPLSINGFMARQAAISLEQPPIPAGLPEVLIVNWRTAYELGGYVASVSMIPKNPQALTPSEVDDKLKVAGQDIALSTDLPVHVRYANSTAKLATIETYSVSGFEIMWVLLAIGAASIVNVLVGTVEQRKREIFIYSSVGLSPAGAAIMFVMESVTYATLAVIIGYILGYGLNLFFVMTFPGIFAFNVSSTFITLSLGTVILTCLLASVYPAAISARLITPSLERKWRYPTKPRGDQWEMPLPLRIMSERELLGILRFYSEYYSGAGAEKPGFVVSKVYPINLDEKSITLDVSLTPMELNISQNVKISFVLQVDKTHSMYLELQRRSGDYDQWVKRNYEFVDDVRKQLMLWSSLPDDGKAKYIG